MRRDTGGIACPSTCIGSYYMDDMVTLTPIPGFGSKFIGWNRDGDCVDGVVTMITDANCTAEFYSFPWPMFLPTIINNAQI